jgi:formate hydrogenlyase subunit 6/NADH:ubiquinone oxidoreductase subunit I
VPLKSFIHWAYKIKISNNFAVRRRLIFRPNHASMVRRKTRHARPNQLRGKAELKLRPLYCIDCTVHAAYCPIQLVGRGPRHLYRETSSFSKQWRPVYIPPADQGCQMAVVTATFLKCGSLKR